LYIRYCDATGVQLHPLEGISLRVATTECSDGREYDYASWEALTTALNLISGTFCGAQLVWIRIHVRSAATDKIADNAAYGKRSAYTPWFTPRDQGDAR